MLIEDGGIQSAEFAKILTSPTKHLTVSGKSFAYREFGNAPGIPLVLLNHLAANLDIERLPID